MRAVELKTQIWAFSIPSGSSAFQLEMPRGAQVVHIGIVKGVPSILARVKPDTETEIRRFALFGTADDIPADVGRYLGTFEDGGYIWHVFEWLE